MIALPLIVGTIGVAGVGTLLSTMAIDTRGRDVMLAILFIPVAFPLLYACVSATGAVLAGIEGAFAMSGAVLPATAPMIALPLIVGTIGVAGVGTLLSTMAIDTRGRDVMLAILFIPVAFPLLYACVSATGAVLAGIEGAFATFWRSLALAGAYDVVMIAAAWGLYEFVLDS